ncbi:LacI family DNA-binding transcriptional regulator [Micromonospora humida]|uniref:LacI family DNA-binding transcriptional regulator n=1 Tax=Micromonospora humida TaxID=2809018 RepID=A0ABS2IRV1_9ACTN|nr:LacI family DNA-binding transcriptional regulator [Micromonospora humida]MBM7077060.1 LacI family DNA-binding transcriptional regulator [Micromonospora humida]
MATGQPEPAGRAGKAATIHEVARAAGVSHQTVSRYLRGQGGLKPQTLEKVTQAIERLNYRPNLAARSMRTRRSGRITVVLPETTDFVPTRLLSGATDAAHEAGYLLDVVGLEGDAAARAERMRTLLSPENVDAVLSFTPLATRTADLDLTSFPVPVLVDGEYDDNMRAQGVLADASPVVEIVGRLAADGHRRFAHVAGSDLWASARNRRRVYETTVAQRGLTSCAVVDGDWTVRSGWEAATTVLPRCGATAVLAANDRVAFGILQGLQSLGIDVPGQISVFGWDDDEIGHYTRPTLSTVSVDRERQGREAMRRLLALLRGEEPPSLPNPSDLHRLLPRQSTGPAPEVAARQA